MRYSIERDFPHLDYQGKEILIIGGGPSTIDVKWENIKTDFVWSCNDFYLGLSL